MSLVENRAIRRYDELQRRDKLAQTISFKISSALFASPDHVDQVVGDLVLDVAMRAFHQDQRMTAAVSDGTIDPEDPATYPDDEYIRAAVQLIRGGIVGRIK